jgi:sulfite exporter TauE/SafE
MDVWVYSAFLVGFLGSFHCAGMCGPIALALPFQQSSGASIIVGRLLYNFGRVITYAFFGLLVGLLGHTISLAGYQGPLSIISGILILLAVFIPVVFKRFDALSGLFRAYSAKLKEYFRILFGKKSKLTMLGIGIVNGFLPCGFVYLALAAAIANGSISGSVSYMTFFGLGTIPMMLTLSLLGKFGGAGLSRFIHKASPIIAVSVGLLLIIRGFTIGPDQCCH